MNPELRLYTFTLAHLNTMQQGIQAAHAAVELVSSKPDDDWVIAWARQYKTMICLNAGDYTELVDLREFFAHSDNPYPYAHFWEDESLARLHTSTAIILPERIYGTAEIWRKTRQEPAKFGFSLWEWELMELINSKSKAR